MGMQIRASFRKEFLAFFRTKRFLVIALFYIGWSILGPLFIRGIGGMMDSLSPVYDEYGMDVSKMTEALGSAVSLGVASTIAQLSQLGLIVFLIQINSAAGGEQKKRAIIIPRSAGLRSFAYIFPKYIIYPLTALVLAVAGAFVSYGISLALFDKNDVYSGGILFAGLLTGVSLMFYVCAHLTLGTATSRSGMSSAVCIIASLMLPGLFAALGSSEIYNPFTLTLLAGSVIYRETPADIVPVDIISTVIIAVGIMLILFFIALFVQNAKKIDNSGNEITI